MGQFMSTADGSPHNQPQPSPHIPKRGARACTACRKGKNRCEGEVRIRPNWPPRPSFVLTVARLPRPARRFLRLHVAAARQVEHLVSLKNQRRRMSKRALDPALSKRPIPATLVPC